METITAHNGVRPSRWLGPGRVRAPRSLVVAVLTACLLGMGVGVAVAADQSGSSITVAKDGTVLDGRSVDGYIHVKADRVVIRNSVIRYDGNYAIRIFDGALGTIIEDTRIYCAAAKTKGVVFGNYIARRVHLINCLVGFRYGPEAPATIVDSTWNGKAVSTSSDLEIASGGMPTAGTADREAGSRDTAGIGSRESSGTDDRAAGDDASATGSRTASGSATAGAENATAASADFPTAATTGVPTGTTLRRSGPLNLTANGQIVSGLDINGCVTVAADNVIIRKSRIRCGSNYSVRTMPGATNLLVEDVEIDGMGTNKAAVCCDSYMVRRTEIKNVIDGPRLGNNTVVEDSWIHHLIRVGSSHNDALQSTGAVNVIVRHNRLEAYNPVTRDPMNACLMAGTNLAPLLAELVFEGNYCNGGNYSINIHDSTNARNVRFAGNAFGRDFRYGPVRNSDHPGVTWETASNVWVDTQLAVPR